MPAEAKRAHVQATLVHKMTTSHMIRVDRAYIRLSITVLASAVWLGSGLAARGESQNVEFNRDIRPILADACFHCHGPDAEQRQGHLRLDTREGAFVDLGGHRAIVPGGVEASALYQRITASEPGERMPPPDSGKTLSSEQVEQLRRWIEQGAPWQAHWSLVAPKRPVLPDVKEQDWPKNAIDYFVLARMEQEGFRPAFRAGRERLIRRVTLDLSGLPPTPHQVDAFLADQDPDAYEKVVDRLLGSPRYGERMALDWLDYARFADTDGYQEDAPRTMWHWRDWVISAYNRNLPFDQFTIEQLAGDILPGATLAQRIATGFNRNHRLNGESGAIAEEFRVEYVADRVETTATVWLGLTFGCARCHDHKYDPISQEDYYRLFAFFNNVEETVIARGNVAPLLQIPSPEIQQRLQQIKTDLSKAEQQVESVETGTEQHRVLSDQIRDLKNVLQDCTKQIAPTMVMQEGPQRDTFLLVRGEYNNPGGQVNSGVPRCLPQLPKEAPQNRLALARWLVGPENPLTSRVAVNRYWRMVFGTGLVKTVEDFGMQGERPSHPELLDWLATRFLRENWDIKSMQRLIVTSETYCQSSRVTLDHLEKDPENRLLARGPRLRLPAETIRDQALSASGLLVSKIGGPSVWPYQPHGLWYELAGGDGQQYPDGRYQQEHGENLYRRSMYTFWRRTIPPPMMTTFDAPSRETCTARRARTNTPLQALALMNEVAFVEAARSLAERVIREEGAPDERITLAFRLVTGRRPAERELNVLVSGWQLHREFYGGNKEAAEALIHTGESEPASGLNADELAAYTAVVNTIFNLDETITKE